MDGPHYFPTSMSPSRTLDAVTSATTHLTAAGHHTPSPLYQSALDVAAAVDASTTFSRFDSGGGGVGGTSGGIPRIPLAEGTSYSPHSLRGSAIQQHLPSSADHSAQQQHQHQHNQFATPQHQHQFPQRGAFIGTSTSHALPHGGPAPASGGALYTTAVPPSAPLSTAKKKRFRKRRGDVANFGWSDYEPETATGDGGGSNTGDPDGGLDDGGEQTGERMGISKTGHLSRGHSGTPRSTTPRRNDRNQSQTPQHTPRGQRTGRQSVGQRTPRGGTPRGQQAHGHGQQRQSPRGPEHGGRYRDPQTHSQGHGNSEVHRASPQPKHRHTAHTPGSKMGRYVEFPGPTVSTPRGQKTKSSGHGVADRDAYTTNNDAFYENGSLGVRGTSGARSGAAASAGAGGFGGWMLEHGEQGSLPLQAVQHIATLERDFAALQGEHERMSELLMHSSRFASTAAVQVAEADARLQIERESDADFLLLVVNPLLRRSVAFGCANQTRSATIQDPAVTAVLDLHKALEAHRLESAKGTDNVHEAVSSMAKRMEKHLSDAAMESGDGAAHRSSEMVSEVRLVGRSTVDALQHSELALGARIAAQSQSVQSSVDTQMGKLQVTLAGLHTDLREFATKANASALLGAQQHQHDHHGGVSATDGDGGDASSSARLRELSELLEKERREKEQVQVALGQAQAQAAAAQQSQQQQLEIIMQLTALKERDTHSSESRQAHQHSLEQRYGVNSASAGGGGGGVSARDIPAASLPLLLAEQGLSPADALALASSFVSTKSSEGRWAASTSVLLMKEVNAHVNALSQIFLDACGAKAELCVAALTGKHSSSEEGGLRKRQHQTVGLLSGVPIPTRSLGTSSGSGVEGGELPGALVSTGVQVEPVMYSSGTGTHDSFSVKVQSVQTEGAVLPSDVAPSSSSPSHTAATSAAAAIDPRMLQQLVSALHHLPRSTTAAGGGGAGTQHHQSQGATSHVPPLVVPDSGNGSSDRVGSVDGIPHNAPLHESVFGSGFGTHSLSSERSLSGGLPTVSISPATPHNAQHMMLPAAAADYVTARDSSSSSRHDSHDQHHSHTATNQQRGAAIGGNVTTVPSSRPAPRGVEKDSPRRKDSRHGAEQHAAPAVGVQPSPRRRSSLEQSLGSGRALNRQSSQQRGSNANQQQINPPAQQSQNSNQSQQVLGSPRTADSAPMTSGRLGAGVSPHSSSIGSETRQRSKVPERRPRATRTNSAQLSPAPLSPDAKSTTPAAAAPGTSSKNDNINVPSASSSAAASAPRAQPDSAHGKLEKHATKSASPHRLSATERVAEALGPNAFGDHADSDTSNMTLSGLDDDDDDAVSGKSSPNPKADAATRRPSKVAATPAATSAAPVASVKVSTSSKSAGSAAAPKAVVKPTSAFDEDTPSLKKQRKPSAKKQHSFFDDSSSGGDHDTDNAATHDTADHHGHAGASATSVDTAHGKGHSTTGGSSVFSSRQASTHGAHDGSDHTKAKIDDNRNHTQSQRRQGEKHLTVSALPPSPLEDMEVRSTHPPPPALGADVLKPVPVTSADTKRAAVVVPKKLSDWDNSDDDDVDDNGGGHDGHGTDEAEIESLTGSLLELEREALSPIPHGATAAKPTAKTTAKTTSSSLSASAAQSTKPPAAAAASSKPATVFASGTSSTAAPMTNPSQLSLARGSADGLGSGGTTPSPLAAQTKQSANTNTNTTVPKQNMNYLSPTSASSTRGGSGSGGGNGGGSPLTPGASAAASRGATPEPRRGRKVSFLGEGDADDGSPSGNASTANAPSHIPIKSPTSMAPGGLGAGAGAAGAGDGQQTKVVPGTHQAPLASLSISSAVTASDSSFSLSPRGTNPSFGLSPLTGGGQQASTSPGGMQQGQASTVRPGKPFVMSPDGRGATPSPGGLVGGGGNTLASAGAAGHFTRAGGGGGGAVSGSRGPSPGATPHAVSANASPGQSPGSSIATAVSAGGRQLPSLSGSSAKATTSAADFFSGVGKKKQLGGAKKLSPL